MLTIRNEQRISRLTMADFSTELGESVRASALEDLIRSPFLSGFRIFELFRARGRMLSIEEVGVRSRAVGLDINEPMSEERLDILIRRKLEERNRQHIILSGPQGAGPTSLRLFAGLATTIVDPINIVSAFIPVVGQARFASLVGRFGKTGARAIRGGLEGLVGAAAVEPVVLFAANQEQADYDFLDSMLNVTFGALLGSGLHVTFGKLGDVRRTRKKLRMADIVRRMDPVNQEASFRAGVADVVEGRMPNPDIYLDADASLRNAGDVDDVELKQSIVKNREQNQAEIITDVSKKLQTEVDRINSPESTILADVSGAKEVESRLPELLAKKDDVNAAEELLEVAEEQVTDSLKTFTENLDEEALIRLGLKREVQEVADVVKANTAIIELKNQERAIRALTACMSHA